jgi:hypothetical protein
MFEEQALRLSRGGHSVATRPTTDQPACGLRTLVLGERASLIELPALPDLAAAVSALARGVRRKVTLP